MRHYIGFDCGTMGTKVAIFAEDSTMVSEAYRPHRIDYPRPGWAEMDPDQFYRAASEGIRECVAKCRVDPRSVRGISCSGIICGIVPIDARWRPVGPYIPYLDGRSKDEVREAEEGCEPLWREEAGNAVFGAYVPPMILRWLLRHEKEMMASAAKVVQGAHYVLGRFAGLGADGAFNDWAHLSGWVIGFDARRRDWSERQIEILGIPRRLLPPIRRPWDVVGALTRREADALGLAAGTPLVAGAGDMQQSCLGSGVVEPDVCSDVAGTASNFNYTVAEPRREITERRLLVTAMHTLDDQYLYWSVIPSGGLSLRWFRDEIMMRQGDEGFYERMNLLAEGLPPAGARPLFFPYLQGRTSPFWPRASAGWLGLYGSSSSAALWRAMLESVAFEYLTWTNLLRSVGISPKRVVGQGGGSRSRLWNQIKADVLGLPYVTVANSEQAVLGNALLAAYGVGDVKDLKGTVREWVKVKDTFVPDGKAHEEYLKVYAKREGILNGPLREIFERLAES